MTVADKAEQDYWNELWGAQASRARPLTTRGVRGLVTRRFLDVIRRAGASLDRPPKRLIEVGCGNSVWMPLLAKALGVDVDGLDYSPRGCAQARANLARESVTGTVYEADLFNPPAVLRERYDLAVSFGVAEHFTPTSSCVEAIGALVRPGGAVVTFVPNFAGLMGDLQRWADPAVYDIHVPLDATLLAAAHRSAGLIVRESGYPVFANLYVVNYGKRINYGTLRDAQSDLLRVGLAMGTGLGWAIGVLTRATPPRAIAPYAACTALRPLPTGA